MPHRRRVDLMVLPSSVQLSWRQRLGFLHPVLTIPYLLQAATPFT